MKIDSIIKISENPFWISETLPYFFAGFEKNKIDFNIIYLLLPFLLTKSIRDNVLITATSNSSFDSLFFNVNRKTENKIFREFNDSLFNKTSLVVIEGKYHYYKKVMNKAVLVAYRKEYLAIKDGDIIPLKKYDYSKVRNKEHFLFDYFKCCRNLGIIFSKETTHSLYRKCQIKSIL